MTGIGLSFLIIVVGIILKIATNLWQERRRQMAAIVKSADFGPNPCVLSSKNGWRRVYTI